MDNKLPIIECQGCDLADPSSTEYNIYDTDCIISANPESTKMVPIRSLKCKQRDRLKSNNNAIHRANFFLESYKQFINQLNSPSNYDPVLYNLKQGYDKDRSQTYFNYH